MAELSHERAQQLLIGGLAIAISLVVLVTVLNGVLFTEDLRTRGTAGELSNANDYEATTVRQYSDLLQRVNEGRYADRQQARSAFVEQAYAINRLTGRHYAAGHGTYASIDRMRVTNGTVLAQDHECEFRAAMTYCGNESVNNPPYATFAYYNDSKDSLLEALQPEKQTAPHYPEQGKHVFLNASNATDPDGDITSYEWILTEGSHTYTKSGEKVTIDPIEPSGTWNVTLVVTDDDGATSTATVEMPVYESDPNELPPNASFTATPTLPVVGETMTLNATATTDVNGDITDYSWTVTNLDDGSTTSLSGKAVSLTPTESGAYTVTLEVTDSVGNADTLTKTVYVDNPLSKGGGVADEQGPFSVGAPTGMGPRLAFPTGVDTQPNATDWTLVTTDTLRRFHITPVRSTLETVPTIKSNDPQTLESTFYIRFEGRDGKTWDVHLFVKSGDNNITVATRTGGADGTATARYSADVSELQVNVTTGTIRGEHVFEFAPGLARPYEVSFHNGDEGNGTYSMVVLTEPSATTAVEHQNFYPADNGREPYEAKGVYSVSMPVTFDAPGTSRVASLRIAPGEPLRFEANTSLDIGEPQVLPRDEIVFVENGTLKSLSRNGTMTIYDTPGSVEAISPKSVDFDGDGLQEIAYVNGSNALRLIDAKNNTQTLAQNARKSKTLLAVGKYEGTISVYYATQNKELYRVSLGSSPSKMNLSGKSVKAVAGIMNFTDDDDREIIFSDGSQQLRWYDDGNQNKINNGGLGSNNGIGTGAPRAFAPNSRGRIPMVDGSNELHLINASAKSTKLEGNVEKSPIAGIEWNTSLDGKEVIYLDKEKHKLYYDTWKGEKTYLITHNGSAIKAKTTTGVA